MPLPDRAGPLVISHAACAGHAPENTLAGVRAALALGADAVEVDVRATADGVPVLMHDHTLDRTTNGTGLLAQRSLDELRRLDVGGEPVPTLAEAMAITGNSATLVAEIKAQGIEGSVVRLIRDARALKQVMVWSFLPAVLAAIRASEPRIPTALLIAPRSAGHWPSLPDLVPRLGIGAVGVFQHALDEHTISAARDSGLDVFAWTADSPGDIRRLIDLRIDGIVTNHPDRALRLLGRDSGSA